MRGKQRRSKALPETAKRLELISVLERLQEATQGFVAAARASASDWWAWTPPGTRSAFTRRQQLERLLEGIQSLHYSDGQRPVEAEIYPGVLCVPAPTLQLAREVNTLKDELYDLAVEMRDRCKFEWNDRKEDYDQLTLFRYALRHAGEGRLNYFQSARHLTVLEPAPRMIGFMWYTPYELKKYTIEQAREQLASKAINARTAGQHHSDLKVLKRLKPNDLLVKRVARPAHPRANVVTELRTKTKRRVVRASLPIVLSSDLLPELRTLPEAPPDEPRERPITSLDPDTYIATLELHRYVPRPARKHVSRAV